jgi:hypothetical protein
MAMLRMQAWWVLLAVGLLAGLAIGGLWPDAPLHAFATDRVENIALATGPVDWQEGIEAMYFLDFDTGSLKAAVISNASKGFQAYYAVNIKADLLAAVQQAGVQLPSEPRYLMVTGLADIRRGAASQKMPARGVVYIAEANTGIVLAYVIPWSPQAHASNQPVTDSLILWAGDRFSSAVVRDQQ